jgi:hypothetical protein
MKSSPGGRRKEGEINGLDENAMDTDSKDDPLIPDDLPRPQIPGECPGSAFLFDWFCLFNDIYIASAQRAKKPGHRDGSAAQQYLDQTQVSFAHTMRSALLTLCSKSNGCVRVNKTRS